MHHHPLLPARHLRAYQHVRVLLYRVANQRAAEIRFACFKFKSIDREKKKKKKKKPVLFSAQSNAAAAAAATSYVCMKRNGKRVNNSARVIGGS